MRDLLPPGKIPGYSRPGSAGRRRGLVELVPVDRWPGLLPVLVAWRGRSCGRGCAYSPGGDAGGIMAGSLGLLPVVDRLPDALENHGKFTGKFPGKMPTKKFFKKFPPMGERSAHENFLQKGG